MQICIVAWLALLFQAAQSSLPAPGQRGAVPTLEKSVYFAFVDHDYIFTVEVVSPGVPLLNFVSMTDGVAILAAKQVRLRLENRTAIGTTFLVDTGDPKQPMITPSLTMHARSSFGARIQGGFSNAKELLGVTIRVGEEDFKLVPLTSLAFENLVLKVNRINLGSPDFRDDWRVLNLETMGTRTPASR
jgi:hypothetical protein